MFLNVVSVFINFVKVISSLAYFCIFQARRIPFGVDCYSIQVSVFISGRGGGLGGVCSYISQAFRSLVCLGGKWHI